MVLVSDWLQHRLLAVVKWIIHSILLLRRGHIYLGVSLEMLLHKNSLIHLVQQIKLSCSQRTQPAKKHRANAASWLSFYNLLENLESSRGPVHIYSAKSRRLTLSDIEFNSLFRAMNFIFTLISSCFFQPAALDVLQGISNHNLAVTLRTEYVLVSAWCLQM